MLFPQKTFLLIFIALAVSFPVSAESTTESYPGHDLLNLHLAYAISDVLSAAMLVVELAQFH